MKRSLPLPPTSVVGSYAKTDQSGLRLEPDSTTDRTGEVETMVGDPDCLTRAGFPS